MKKKILLILLMFTFITNVNALTFNVDVTNIEEEGNETLGEITNIDVSNKTVDAYFQDIGDEVDFSITITNTGDRAGTLREITFEPGTDKIEYTSNLPEGGLAINGNDTNKVIIKAKVKEGAQNGKTASEVKIKYTYDEGSCPDGEILSEDESMCLCPEGMERNENGICVKPEKKVECADDEIYNETKKICEKKVVPVTPSNPKTLDNIILITLLFFVSGLGIYAVIFKKLKTKKTKITAAVITVVTTLTLSFTVLASVFGLDNLLGAIINPITKSKELIVTVNEEIDLIETWDGDCDVTGALTPDNVFDGGAGTESDPYQIKTANQLACFAKSVNEGETYEGKFVKQTKNIKLNDNLNDQVEAGDLSNEHVWISAGYRYYDDGAGDYFTKSFSGQYDGDNKTISGLYITNDSISQNAYANKGLFGYTVNATFKNMKLSDTYVSTGGNAAALLGYGHKNLTLDNITTYGNAAYTGWGGAGIVAYYSGNGEGTLTVTNSTNNIDLSCSSACSGLIHKMEEALASDEPTIIFRNNTNNGSITFTGDGAYEFSPLFGYITNNDGTYLLADNNHNTGDVTTLTARGTTFGGIVGYASVKKLEIKNSDNTGTVHKMEHMGHSGGIVGKAFVDDAVIENCFNSGNFEPEDLSQLGASDNVGGILGFASVNNSIVIKDCYNTGDLEGNYAYLGGILGTVWGGTSSSNKIENCYNTGDLKGYGYVGGIFSYGEITINKTYNTGDISTINGPMTGGIVGYSATVVTNSYNTGLITNNGGGYTGGICGHYCDQVKNSYNRGNVIANNSATEIGGITGYNMGSVENVYNSGDVIYTNSTRYGNSGYLAGISAQGGTVKNSYNLGDVIFHVISGGGETHIDGIAVYARPTNCVNKGKVTAVIDEPLAGGYFQMNGISYYQATDCFNAGKVEIDDSALDTPISEDGNVYNIKLGQITEMTGSGNKFNTDPNGFAIGCKTGYYPCTSSDSEAVGVYTTEEEPDILSIINGDGAFNEELDEDGLPTLKIFNE